ncbi:GTP-binding protein [Arhodomonas aquaeolei]|uniref:GTP-binding protein n=1 Tax=Arhodomonas aquaeolei TaxID=2369 RepID=UPI002169DCEA|nr:GTP-binding protein [Arhodomonas aquaeolei]MCS4503538.1 GTP-binding protein [Arhodomonas aquaeolei]
MPPPAGEDTALLQVRESLEALLADRRVPEAVRTELDGEYRAVAEMLERLEHGHIYIAAVGRVSAGKSSLLNALLGRAEFTTSALHGETLAADRAIWRASDDGHCFLYDTPGLEEIAGEDREATALRTAASADLVVFVADGDLTRAERRALEVVCAERRPVILVLNKADRYAGEERDRLLVRLREHAAGLVAAENVIACAADPAPRRVVVVAPDGSETERRERPPAAVSDLADRLWAVVESEGKALAALNAGLFASRVSDRVAARITELRRSVARRVTDAYALGKGVAVAVNPVPVADLAGAAALDVTLVFHLGRVYGLPVTRREAGRLVAVIIGQLSALLGAVWSVNLFASLAKLGTGGAATALTASAQGAVGYASTWILGRVAEDYFRRGGSWGESGPKRAVEAVIDGVDTESLLAQAKEDIRRTLRGG